MTPIKPFDTYKWRWLSTTPTEGLLEQPVFLGALRAFAKFDGRATSDSGLLDALQTVKEETHTRINLGRSGERNLIRNSGQYWKGTGLLAATEGQIEMTDLGVKVASGEISQGEFVAIMVQQTVLPNPWTTPANEIAKWRAAKLEIRPLKLILEVLSTLGRTNGLSVANISNHELVHILIPMAGAKSTSNDIAEKLVLFRAGSLNIAHWPDCAPGANDHRMAREFLLFLANFGMLRLEASGNRDQQKFYLDEIITTQVMGKTSQDSIFSTDREIVARAIQNVEHSDLPSIVERQRIRAEVLVRKGQPLFRSKTLNAFQSICLLTSESISTVLEAAHIVPVKHGGSDDLSNCLCLRSDVHRLFDAGKIRLKADGTVTLSDAVNNSPNYSQIPRRIEFPQFVNPVNVRWRDEYL